ncbi:hypothetical protein D3C78_1880980 [compost metagenome]
MMQQGIADEAIAAASGDHLVKADIELAELFDIEVFDGDPEQLLGAVTQQREACAIDLEARRQ